MRVLRCHRDRTKRIATENSPSLFLTVSEDGTVRQHDLRRPHRCRDECPDPLFRAPRGIDLYSLSVSTVTPHMFAVAGMTDVVSLAMLSVFRVQAYLGQAFLCDRRMPERQTPSWGSHVRQSEEVHCVRKLGMTADQWTNERGKTNGYYSSEKHITCVKMSPHHADEVRTSFQHILRLLKTSTRSSVHLLSIQPACSPSMTPLTLPRLASGHPRPPSCLQTGPIVHDHLLLPIPTGIQPNTRRLRPRIRSQDPSNGNSQCSRPRRLILPSPNERGRQMEKKSMRASDPSPPSPTPMTTLASPNSWLETLLQRMARHRRQGICRQKQWMSMTWMGILSQWRRIAIAFEVCVCSLEHLGGAEV